jgi:hypothetical protein
MGWSWWVRARPSGITAWPGFWRTPWTSLLVYTYVLDPASGRYRDSEVLTGVVKLTVPFSIEVDLGQI